MRLPPIHVTVLLCLVCLLESVCAADASWWNDGWKYRIIARVVPQERRAGINTARIKLAEQSKLCAEDGHDVRVLDQQGRLLPHHVEKTDDGLQVSFLVRSDANQYYLYYGNPKAPPARHQWEQQLGGLTLETYALPHTVYRASQIPGLLQQELKSFGKDSRRQINDLENPFGPNDRYISVYEGTIYCPEDGQYAFAINADDMAIFQLEMGQQTLLRCSRNAGVPSEDWKDPQHKNAYTETDEPLQRGVYRVRYFHVENGGAQLAKLGWRRPSSDAVVTVPPRSFVQYLPVEIRGRQVQGKTLNPFFVSHHRYNLVVNDGRGKFPHHFLESRSGEEDTGSLSYHWAFGDGTSADGRSVEHEFPRMQPYDVTLTVKNADGESASITRRVIHSPEPIKRMTLRMEVQFEDDLPIMRTGRRARFQLFLKNISSVQRSLRLETLRSEDPSKREPERVESRQIENLSPAVRGPTGWKPVPSTLSLPRRNLYLTLRLLMHDVPLVEKKLAVLSTDRPLGELTQDRAHNLRDSEGRLVLLRLADVELPDVPPRNLSSGTIHEVRMLVIDERVAGPPDAENPRGYVRVLTESLQEKYPALTFPSSRPELGLGEEYPLIGRFLATYRRALEADPDLVILVGQLESVVDTVPPEAFESYLVAAVDQILSQTRAHVILVTPPPLPGRPNLSRQYARLTKKTGLHKGLVVADLYSRFMLTSDWKELFKPFGGERPSYQLYPNREGQRIISQEVFNSIITRLHEDLSRANRKASLRSPSH